MPLKSNRIAIAVLAMVFSSSAMAHPGHGNGLVAGMLHPLLGLDHLLAMLAVGGWAAQLNKRAQWLVPASFVVCMALAASIAMAGVKLPVIEGGIASSVLLIGLLIAFSVRVQPALGSLIVAVFALFHGYAHGIEMPAQTSAALYGAGFVLSTVGLNGLGMLIGSQLRRQKWLMPATGAALAACGGWMLAGVA